MSADLHPQELKRALDRARERYFMALEARKALPPVQEDKMDSQQLKSEALKKAHRTLQHEIETFLSGKVREFQRATGLDVHAVDVQMGTFVSRESGAENIVHHVDVRVGLGR